jgi:hypothetical protein
MKSCFEEFGAVVSSAIKKRESISAKDDLFSLSVCFKTLAYQ